LHIATYLDVESGAYAIYPLDAQLLVAAAEIQAPLEILPEVSAAT